MLNGYYQLGKELQDMLGGGGQRGGGKGGEGRGGEGRRGREGGGGKGGEEERKGEEKGKWKRRRNKSFPSLSEPGNEATPQT